VRSLGHVVAAAARRPPSPAEIVSSYGQAMDPKGRIAVVTGAAGGIGGALVRALAGAGARAVVATDLEEPVIGAAPSTEIVPRQLDVTDEVATGALVAEVESSIGPVDLWFANAGLAGRGGPDVPDAVWERQWQVNVMAHVHAARALLPGWTARGEGHLITTASMAGLLTTLGDGVYAATKHAAVGFAEWMAITYGAQGIKVSCVCPGAVDTAMLRAGAAGDAAKAAAGIGGGEVLAPDAAAARIVDAVAHDRFLILTHPEMQELVVRKAQDPDRWIKGMQRLWARTQELLRE
jgi:NAD(P)-dependent dehydrogenase (short-subunit alcohol dehydrogenase family)